MSYIEVDRVRNGNFGDGSVGRSWRTHSGLYRIGDIHITPQNFREALFAELVVLNYGDGNPRTIITDSTEQGSDPSVLEALLRDDVFVTNAITTFVESLSGNIYDRNYR